MTKRFKRNLWAGEKATYSTAEVVEREIQDRCGGGGHLETLSHEVTALTEMFGRLLEFMVETDRIPGKAVPIIVGNEGWSLTKNKESK